MTKFEYDNEGNLIVIRNGKKIGQMITMGDVIQERPGKVAKENEQDTGNQPQEKRRTGI